MSEHWLLACSISNKISCSGKKTDKLYLNVGSDQKPHCVASKWGLQYLPITILVTMFDMINTHALYANEYLVHCLLG